MITARGHGDGIRMIDGHACFILVGGNLMNYPGSYVRFSKLEVSTQGIGLASLEPTKT